MSAAASAAISVTGLSTKIDRRHLDRAAVVYVRQSTLAQVREHTESTARQYALAEQAVALGWDRRDVAVIDADLGVSGRSTEGRDGFRGLVSRVCLGEVGAIFGLEISRLARSSARSGSWPGSRPGSWPGSWPGSRPGSRTGSRTG